MNAIEVRGLSKKFTIYQQQKTLFRLSKSFLKGLPITRELWALKDVTFSIAEGEKVAVVGRNGAGKTTLFRILAGIYEPAEGTVQTPDEIKALFNYGLGFNPSLSALDNLYVLGAYQGLLVSEIREKLEAIVEFSGLKELLYLPAKDLSSGQKQRLLFSVFIQTSSPCLLLDESVSLADLGFQKKSEAWFKQAMNSGRTILMTSHNLDFLKAHCPRTIWLEKGVLKADGPSEAVIDDYARYCLEAEKTSAEVSRP